MKTKAEEAVRVKVEQALTELENCSNGMFRLVEGLKIDSMEDDGRRCMKGSYGKLCFSEKKGLIVWKIIW